MAYFAVTYDLMQRKDYKRLTDELERLGGARPALSVWFVERLNTDAFRLRDHLLQYMDGDDKLVVIEFEKQPAYARALKAGADWVTARFG